VSAILLVCPNCGHEFPVLPVTSTGSCKCGLDYEATFHGATLLLEWTPDTKFPGSGTETYSESFSMAP
jgi:hypothetical protein